MVDLIHRLEALHDFVPGIDNQEAMSEAAGRLRFLDARLSAADMLLQETQIRLGSWNTTSGAPEKGCPCHACQNTRLERRIEAYFTEKE